MESASQSGGEVIGLGRTSSALAVIVVYPNLVETYTFVRSQNGAEVIWSSNKFATPILKIAAYRAPCSVLNLG